MLTTMERDNPEQRLWMRHRLALPSCCPVSGNPQPGSEIVISYRAGGTVLEVYALSRYLYSFIGGHPSGTRTMEGMVEQIARDCAATVGVRVRVRAKVVLQQDRESLEILAEG